jgi:Flp pilus assembly protein TadD
MLDGDWSSYVCSSDLLFPRNLGIALARLGRQEEAVAALREADRLRPEDPRTLDLLGMGLARLGRVGEARELLGRAARLDPASAKIRADLRLVAELPGAPSPGASPSPQPPGGGRAP